MLQEFIEQICSELTIEPVPKLNARKKTLFTLNEDIKIDFTELDPGISMQTIICPCPEKRKEELFMFLMNANFLGQGTGGARIGLDRQEKFITLCLGLPYELPYQGFKKHLEDFANHLIYWRAQMIQFEREKNLI
jgi:hypothetical protein